jgi:uncharacterized protein
MAIIGRYREKALFNKLLESDKSSFVAMYGRRRIGKTYLIRSYFENFTFHYTGVVDVDTKQQLERFHKALCEYGKSDTPMPKTWFEAFDYLKDIIAQSRKKKKVVFIDEMPWMNTPRSKFMPALEHFWNHWASQRTDLIFLVCGSASSWIVKKLFNSRGGLHNRVTHKIHLKPFTLAETEEFFENRKFVLNQYQIVKAYMVFGGVPFYLEQMEREKSIDQNIDNLLFNRDGALVNEFSNLYEALYTNPQNYIEIIKALSTKNKGLSRYELLDLLKLKSGGTLSTLLEDLELSGFIRKYHSIGKKQRNVLYQLTDAYSLFYFNFLEKKPLVSNDWLNALDSPKNRSWSGYAFEMVCLQHTDQIKHALGISGIQTHVYAWQTHHEKKNIQIDLLIDRKDQTINLFEIKYSSETYTITTKYLNELLEKVALFKHYSKTKKAVHLSMMTTYGLTKNEHSGMMLNDLNLKHLFASLE